MARNHWSVLTVEIKKETSLGLLSALLLLFSPLSLSLSLSYVQLLMAVGLLQYLIVWWEQANVHIFQVRNENYMKPICNVLRWCGGRREKGADIMKREMQHPSSIIFLSPSFFPFNTLVLRRHERDFTLAKMEEEQMRREVGGHTQIHLCSFLFSENTITVIRLIPTPIERWVSLSLSLSTKFILKVYWEVLNHIPVVQLCKWSIFVPWSLPQKAKKKKQNQRKNHLYLK